MDVPIFLISGIINFLLLLFQLLSGLHVIKVKFRLHKITGIALFVFATLHAILAILAD